MFHRPSSPRRNKAVLVSLFGAAAGLSLVWHEHQLPPCRKPKVSQEPYPFGLLLGCSVHDDGSLGREMKLRCHLAIDQYLQGKYHTLIISGGAVRNPYVEAEVMGNYIHELCPQLPILLETQAQNTWENMKYAREMIGDQPILILTGGLHARRSNALARQFFSNWAMESAPDFTWKKAGREAISRIIYLWIELKKTFKRQ